ncbi:MAG: glycosyltransferase family 87 protein [Gemmataceae bacterium]
MYAQSMDLSAFSREEVRRRFTLYALVLAAVMLGMLWRDLNERFYRGDRPTSGINDYFQEYIGGWMVRQGDHARFYDPDYANLVEHDSDVTGFHWPGESYLPMIYPPFYYLLVAPLSFLPLRVAATLWLGLISLCLAATIWLWLRAFPGRARADWLIPAALLFPPTIENLTSGQKATILLLILTATFLLLRRGSHFVAGFVFGLVAFKPHLGLLVGLVFLCKGQWRFVAGSLLMVALLVALSFAVGGDVCAQYAERGKSMAQYIETPGYDLSRSHSWYGFFRLYLAGAQLATVQTLTLAAALATLAILAFLFRGRLETGSPTFAIQYSGLIVALVVLSPHLYTYDQTLLLLPMFLTLMTLLETRDRHTPEEARRMFILLAAFYALVAVSTYVAKLVPVQVSVGAMLVFLLLSVPVSQSLRAPS